MAERKAGKKAAKPQTSQPWRGRIGPKRFLREARLDLGLRGRSYSRYRESSWP